MQDRPTKLQAYQTYIDGKWCDAASGKAFQTFNPYTGDAWATIPECDKIDADRACEAAMAGDVADGTRQGDAQNCRADRKTR